jgi:hypothetical protein
MKTRCNAISIREKKCHTVKTLNLCNPHKRILYLIPCWVGKGHDYGMFTATFEQRLQLVELLIDRVVVTSDQVEIRYAIPTGCPSVFVVCVQTISLLFLGQQFYILITCPVFWQYHSRSRYRVARQTQRYANDRADGTIRQRHQPISTLRY